jgi:uncharacterized protein (TIGR03084 family)
MEKICIDLKAEHDDLGNVLSGLDEKQWQIITPFFDWTIKDQIRHLAYFDDRAALAAVDPEGFSRHIKEEIGSPEGLADHIEKVVGDRSVAELSDWWKKKRSEMLNAFRDLNPKDRLPWYGPPMSALSFATARLMETWAHGQDVFDGLGQERIFTDRLRNIAHLGVTTFAWSYINRGLEAPQKQVRVELTAPSGDVWTWGLEDAGDKVTGPAEDFCLVVAPRRHMGDTRLEVIGDVARDWMEKAQCFAGPATDGPAAGERI